MAVHQLTALGVAAAVVVLAPTAALAGPKGGSSATPAGACSVSGSTVTGTGLPTDQLLNFMVTDAGGRTGWVLGTSGEGTWSVTVPQRTSPTTYEFVSRTWGKDGSQYTVFASCSA